MRLIDADALLEHIKDIPTWWADEGGEYGSSRKYPDAMFYPEDIISAIECADTIDIKPMRGSDSLDAYLDTTGGRKMGEWIDVRDKLPEDARYVLVAVRNALRSAEGWYSPLFGWNALGWGLNGWGWIDHADVTHWMPYPKMPFDNYRRADPTWYKIICPCEEPIKEELADG